MRGVGNYVLDLVMLSNLLCVCVCVCAQGNGRLDVRGCEKRIGYCLSVFSVASSSLLFV